MDKGIKGGQVPTDPRERWLARGSLYDMFDGRHHLVPFLQTCRRWNSAANEILCKEIYAGTSPSVIDLFTLKMIVLSRLSKTSFLPFLHHLTFHHLYDARLVLSTHAHNHETTFHEIENPQNVSVCGGCKDSWI